MLNARAERRGRELLEERVELVESELRVEERTRLAVELHDSIAQNIMGVALQLDTADKLVRQNAPSALQHLDIASKALESCHAELRACIWDLRNLALEEQDMNEAIRRTVSQHLDGATLTVRFNVPRDMITDNTAHALLRIIRELVTNAIRHGRAKNVKVAGAIENGKLLFSVSDNGSGFDVRNHPGMAQGHFGLQGIRERVKKFNGEMKMDSVIGRGTRVCISLTMPTTQIEGEAQT
jgi:signal transduction histidine kinase